MAITFSPRPGTVLLCDYGLGRGEHVPPEMTKRRPVVVLSRHSWRQRRSLVIVVPLSTAAPPEANELNVRIAAGSYAFLRPDVDSWAKCDCVSAVSIRRLDRLLRRRSYIEAHLRATDFADIVRATIHAVGGNTLAKG